MPKALGEYILKFISLKYEWSVNSLVNFVADDVLVSSNANLVDNAIFLLLIVVVVLFIVNNDDGNR